MQTQYLIKEFSVAAHNCCLILFKFTSGINILALIFDGSVAMDLDIEETWITFRSFCFSFLSCRPGFMEILSSVVFNKFN